MAEQHYTPGTVVLALGTKRGLFLMTSHDRRHWDIHPTALNGSRIFYAMVDQRAGYRLLAADNGDFSGNFVRYSDDWGQTWHEPKQGIQFPQEGNLSSKNIWVIEPGRPDEPDTVYAGVDPASLRERHDRGQRPHA